MITEKMRDAINNQVNRELYSAYLYLSMSAYFGSVNLKGFAHWMRMQVKEELVHAMKLYDYLVQRGGRAVMLPIGEPPSEWISPLEAFEHASRHEQNVTGLISDLVKVAVSERDDDANNFLQWFVKEQVEEEESAGKVVQKIRSAGSDLSALDRKLAKRVFHPPKASPKSEKR
jgi:ferritin